MLPLIATTMLGLVAAGDPGEDATRFLERCRDGKFEEAAGPFDATLSKVLPAPKLKETWDGLIRQVGRLKSMGTPRKEPIAGSTRVRVRCEFDKAELDALVSFNAEGKIQGFFMTVPAPLPSEEKAPSYIDASKFEETEVLVGAEGWPLKGTLTRPKGVTSAPLVVLVHGSGPHDRDETIGPNAPFRDLAQGLGSRGIAVLRYEKRTLAHQAKLVADPKAAVTLDAEVVDDALAAVAKGRTLPGIDPKRVYVLGHSLGGSLAPTIARRDGKLAGIILLAATARKPDVVVLEQLQYLADHDASQAEECKKLRAQYEGDFRRLREGSLKEDESLMGIPVGYWKDWLALDPAKEAAALKGVPMLILRGGRDYQVTGADVEVFRAALKGRPNVVVHVYPKLNHLFQPGEGLSLPAEYLKAGHVDPKVIEDIVGWIKGGKRS